MRRHELLQHLLFLQLFVTGQTHRLLSLVEHHLLHCLTSVSVEVAQLAVLRLHFLGVDFGVAHQHALPPLHLVVLLQREDHLVVLQSPQTVVHNDALVEQTVDDGMLTLDTNLELKELTISDISKHSIQNPP